MPTFTVDTHLFRELGALLVGRDSTALVELIKNSYDADASRVTVFAENLHTGTGGRVVIADDGSGMTREQFAEGFLRIASRWKDRSERRSTRYKRHFTGAKGIGRLAAHKLAAFMTVHSVAASNGHKFTAIDATIDWDKIEALETLDD